MCSPGSLLQLIITQPSISGINQLTKDWNQLLMVDGSAGTRVHYVWFPHVVSCCKMQHVSLLDCFPLVSASWVPSLHPSFCWLVWGTKQQCNSFQSLCSLNCQPTQTYRDESAKEKWLCRLKVKRPTCTARRCPSAFVLGVFRGHVNCRQKWGAENNPLPLLIFTAHVLTVKYVRICILTCSYQQKIAW